MSAAWEAATQAERSSAKAGHFRAEASYASEAAQGAEQGARAAEAAAEAARDENVGAEAAAQHAAELALETDALLLEEEAQKVAAQVSEEQPFGVLGKPLNKRSLLRAGFAVTVGALLAIALGETVVALEQPLLLIVVAAFIAIGLEPVVTWLTGHHLRRGLAVLVVSVVGVGLVASFLAAAVPPLVSEASQLINNGPQYLQQLQDKHTSIGRLNARFHLTEELTAANQNLSITSFGGLLSLGQAIISFTFAVVIVIVLVLYILADFDGIKRVFYRLVPLHRRPRVALLTDEILARIGGYILGNLLTSLIAVMCQYIILRALGVPYALVLSVFVGVLDLVPLVGSTIAGALVTAVTLATVSLTAAIINVVFTLVYRLAEDYLINPRVLKRTVNVRPLVTVVAVLLGGALLGIVGALLAVPIAAAIQLILTEVVYPRMDRVGAD
ncbi:MAG: putative rane protein [Jatrophihabitantaceae bacterium]|nr:putative rane protein [Jatrophihabitantaceae bacterium]